MPNVITYLKLFAAVTAWGGTFVAAKFAVIYSSVEMSALLRFTSASMVLLIILYRQSGTLPPLNRLQLIYVFLLGLSGVAIYNLFFFFGLQSVEAGRGALIITSNPLWVALGSALFFGHRFHLINISGLILCILGVSIVLSKGQLITLFSSSVGMGELALLGGAISWAVYTLIGKYLMHSQHPLTPLTLVTYSSISGSIILALWMLISGHDMRVTPTLNLVAAIGYLSLLGTVMGFIWFFEGVQKLGAPQSSVFVFFVPVSAILFGYLWLDERITLSLLLGAALIIGGVVMVNKTGQVKPVDAG